jgi:hypothetical protein
LNASGKHRVSKRASRGTFRAFGAGVKIRKLRGTLPIVLEMCSTFES